MSRRQKRALVVIGLVLVFVSLLLVIYTFWPLPGVLETVPLAPTLFAPPQ